MAAFTDFALFYETAGINQVTPFDFMLVGLGGGLGSLLRWWIGRLVGERYQVRQVRQIVTGYDL